MKKSFESSKELLEKFYSRFCIETFRVVSVPNKIIISATPFCVLCSYMAITDRVVVIFAVYSLG